MNPVQGLEEGGAGAKDKGQTGAHLDAFDDGNRYNLYDPPEQAGDTEDQYGGADPLPGRRDDAW